MIYQATITTPANTNYSNRLKTVLRVTKGLVYFVEIYIPAGASGLHHIQIFDGNFQFIPTTPSESITGDNIMIKYDEVYFKTSEPYQFTVHTWNNDDTFEHTVTIRIGMVTERVFMARFLPTLAYEMQIEALKQMKQEQEQIKQEQANLEIPTLGLME